MSDQSKVSQTNALAIYQKIDNPMTAITELGKLFQTSQIMGVSTPGDGAVLALTCMCEGITPLEFAKTYHIINGRPSMRADMMHAKFREAGGKIQWKNLGDDGKLAEAVFEFDGQSIPVAYTIEDARAVVGDKVDKPDSNWRKDRGAMLRARLITKAVRILAPELIAGVYTPEEIESSAVQTQTSQQSIASRRAELLESSNAATASESAPVVEFGSTSTGTSAVVVSVGSEIVSTVASMISSVDSPSTNEQRQELVALAAKVPKPDGSGPWKPAEVAAKVCEVFKIQTPQEATFGQMAKLIENFRTQLSRANG